MVEQAARERGIVAVEQRAAVVQPRQRVERAQRELEKSRKELESLDAKLVNEQFVKNAPPAIVEGAKARQAELRARIEKLLQNQ